MAKRNFYIKESELDNYQVKVIQRRTDNSFIVKGCAGSGKSILALWKVKQIHEEKRGTYLFIVKTIALSQYMRDGISQIGIPPQNIVTFNKCFSWNKDENGKWIDQGWKKGSVDYIVVDEAQDFSEKSIKLLKEKANKALILYGDSAQQLYDFIKDAKPISIEDMAYIMKLPMEQLVFNHRLPKKIARLAEKVNCENDDLETRCIEEGIELPKIYKYSNINEQLDAIIEIIKNRDFLDVGILFRKKTDVAHAYNYLSNKGFVVEATIEGGSNNVLNFNTTNPKLMNYHNSKGLQFEAVFLPECSDSSSDGRNALYVAITRSYQSLYIMHSGNLSLWLKNTDENLYESTIAEIEEIEEL